MLKYQQVKFNNFKSSFRIHSFPLTSSYFFKLQWKQSIKPAQIRAGMKHCLRRLLQTMLSKQKARMTPFKFQPDRFHNTIMYYSHI